MTHVSLFDLLQWEYLPVYDNEPGDQFHYSLSIFTALRSSRHLTSTVYIILKGEKGSTNERIVKTDSRKVLSFLSSFETCRLLKQVDLLYLLLHTSRRQMPCYSLISCSNIHCLLQYYSHHLPGIDSSILIVSFLRFH